MKKDFVVFDFETTGLTPPRQIIEIGALKIKNGRVVDKFHMMVKPTREIEYGAQKAHGITMEDLKDAAGIRKALPKFLKFIDFFPLVGHNISGYDIPILQEAMYQLRYGELKCEVVDTLTIARKLLPKYVVKNHKLETLLGLFGKKKNVRHRAIDDCYDELFLYRELSKLARASRR